MPWPETPADQKLLADANLTRKQLQVFQLRLADISFLVISRALDIDPSTVRGHMEAAQRKLRQAKENPSPHSPST